MNRIIITCLMLGLTGCATDTERKTSTEALASLVKEHAFREKPKLNASTQFKIEEYRVEGLQEELKIQLFLVRYMSPDGQQFNERLLIYRDGKLTPFASAFGGHGLMSAVMVKDTLYYTYSFGSGTHRSHVAQLSVDNGEVRIVDSGGHVSIDLFVRKAGGRIQVESGRFRAFNSWELSKRIGWAKVRASSLVIVDEAGAEITPELAAMKQGIQQSPGGDSLKAAPQE